MAPLFPNLNLIHYNYVVGTPIAQVKSPSMVSEVLQQRSFNAVCIPAHVAPAQLAAFFAGVKTQQNVDGIMVTVPHKISFTDLCDSVSEHAQFLHTVNVVRRNANGTWQGDMFVGDIVAHLPLTAWIETARQRGCRTSTGLDMFASVRDLITDFLLKNHQSQK